MLIPKGESMRRFFILFLLLIGLPLAARGEMYIRIIARDDSLSAQQEKNLIRNEILPLLPENARDLPQALQEIERNFDCRAEIRPWAPAGRPLRPTVYITLGEGQGHNWWGILFPDSLRLAKMGETEAGEIIFRYPIFTFLFGWLWAP